MFIFFKFLWLDQAQDFQDLGGFLHGILFFSSLRKLSDSRDNYHKVRARLDHAFTRI